MAKCPKCGADIADGMEFCPLCGAPMQAEKPAESEFKEKVEKAAEEVKEKATAFASDVKEKLEEAKEAAKADDNDVYDAEDINKNKAFAILAYLGILFLIPLLAAKDSKFARFHTNQGLILFICWILASILGAIPVIKFFAWIVEVALFVLCIIGILNAAKGEAKELPVVGKYRFIK